MVIVVHKTYPLFQKGDDKGVVAGLVKIEKKIQISHSLSMYIHVYTYITWSWGFRFTNKSGSPLILPLMPGLVLHCAAL